MHSKTPLAPGRELPFTVPGTSVVVSVTNASRPGAPVFQVITRDGGFWINAWSACFDDEDTARAEARRAVKAFHAHESATGIERRRAELVRIITEQRARQSRRMHNQALLDSALAESDALRDFDDMRVLRSLRADPVKAA